MKTKIRLLPFMGLILLISLFSCDLPDVPEQDKPVKEYVSINFDIMGIQNYQMKSLDMTQWIHVYNPNQYEIKFVGPETYTFQKSITELKTGFSIPKMAKGTYTITYTSTHVPLSTVNVCSKYLDIKINQSITVSTSGTITLSATPDDYLVMLDFPCIDNTVYIYPNTQKNNFIPSVEKDVNLRPVYHYAYINWLVNPLVVYYNSINSNIINVQLGNIYYVTQGVDGNITFDMDSMIINNITF